MRYKPGDHAWIIENGGFAITEVVIESVRYGRYTISFFNRSGMIRLPEHRLYQTREEAEAARQNLR